MSKRKIALLNLLRFRKTDNYVFPVVRSLAPKAIDMTLVFDSDDKNDIEKILLLSAFILDFDPCKDMKSDFICGYVIENLLYILRHYSTEDLIYFFESNGYEISFVNAYDRQIAVDETVRDYIIARLILYRKIAVEYSKGNVKHLNSLYNAIIYRSFDMCRYIREEDIDLLGEYMMVPSSIDQYLHDDFIDMVSSLYKLYYNKVPMSRISSFFKKLDSGEWHTEGILPFLRLQPYENYLTFYKLPGYGDIVCQDCGNRIENVIGFCHGSFEATLGRQCPQCGTFCQERNVSKEFHSFGPTEQDVVCPQCGFTIRRKEESIYKGRANPIFCPKCESANLIYEVSFIT